MKIQTVRFLCGRRGRMITAKSEVGAVRSVGPVRGIRRHSGRPPGRADGVAGPIPRGRRRIHSIGRAVRVSVRSGDHDSRPPNQAARARTAAWAYIRPSALFLSYFFSPLSNLLWSGLEVALAGKIHPLASHLWEKKSDTLREGGFAIFSSFS